MKSILIIAFFILPLTTVLQAQENAIYFDGTGDYIAIADNPTLAVSGNDFTLSFWITLGDLNRVHDGLFGRNDYQWMAMEYNHDGDRRLNLWIDRTGTSGWELNNLKPAKTNWVQNQWYHIAVVREASTIKIYIDGVQEASTGFTGSIFNPSGVPLYFGRSQLSTRYHIGQIDDIRFWSYAQTQQDLQSSYRARIKGTEPGLNGYWDMNTSSGSTAFDRTVNNNHATLYNDASFTGSTAPVNLNPADKPFGPVRPTGLPYTIIITDLKINSNPPPPNTQIGIYDDTLCVGAGIYTTGSLSITCWEKDAGQGYPGFINGQPISYKIRTTWYTKTEIFNATATYSDGNGNFGTGLFSAATLNTSTILAPDILISRSTVNFNAIQVGTPKTDTITIRNTGNANLVISNITSPLANYTMSWVSRTLIPGDKDTLIITFTPTASVDYETTLTIASDDPDELSSFVTLNGTGLPAPDPQMVIAPTSLLFNAIANGSSQTLTFNILNIGDGTLNITNISSSNGLYTITSPVSFSITQGQNRDISVRFAPLVSGTHTTTITVYSNDGNSTVTATGYSTAAHFTSVAPTGLPYNLIIEDIAIDTFLNVKTGEEVAVFDGAVCAGSAIIQGGKLLNCNATNYAFNIPAIALPSQYTLEAWMLFPLPATGGGWRTLFYSSSNHHPVMVSSTGELGVYNNGFIGSGFNVNTLSAGWHFISAVASGSTTTFYIDGIYKGTSATKETAALTYIGNAGVNNQQSGFSDEHRVWNYARVPQQITGDMNRKLTGTEPGLMAYWNFSNNSRTDLAGGRAGTLAGGATIGDGSALPDQINIIAWEKDVAHALNGFTDGNPMSFKIWTNQYQQNLELNGTAHYTIGNGTFGNGLYSVLSLTAATLLEPRIKLSTHRLYAGQVNVNQTTIDSFSIKNTGNAALQVFLNESSVSFSINRTSATLNTGDSVFIRVTFSPLSSGNHITNLTINSNDPDSAQLIVKLEGFANPPGVPDIALSTTAIDFGGIIKSNLSSAPFNVINIGTAPLNITGITSSNPAFTVTPTTFTLANTNDNQGVYVTFQPASRGLYTGTITINSNAGTRIVTVRGVGYDGHFASVGSTGLPYSIIITNSNLAGHINIGDEIGLYDGSLCVGSSAVLQDTGNIQVVAWKADAARSLQGFTTGNPITFRIWSEINGFQAEFNASASFLVGNGTFGYGFYTVAELIFSLPQITVTPASILVALQEPDTTARLLQISNTGDEDLVTHQFIRYTGGIEHGRTASFDGSNDYIGIGTYGPVQWTAEAWVKPSSTPAGRKTIVGGFGSCTDWGISMIDGRLGVVVRPVSGCSQYINPVSVVSNRWYHIAATNDGTEAKIYVDGVLYDSIQVATNYTGYTDMRIGGEACCAGNNFPGLIDEVRIWNFARTRSQILSTMYDTLVGNESGLVAYYTFNNGTAEDIAGTRNGTLQNGSSIIAGNAPLYSWLRFSDEDYIIPSAQSVQDTLTFISTGLYEGLYTAELIIYNNTISNPSVVLPVSLNVSGKAQIDANRDSISFGQIITGEKDTIQLILQNIGSKDLVISAITIPDGANTKFSILETISFPLTLTPVASQTLSVVFAPIASGLKTDSIIIISNDSVHLPLHIPLSGTGQVPPDIHVSTTVWSGTLVSGTVQLDTFYIRNTGQTALTYNINEMIPWLSLNPSSGILTAGDSVAVQLNISAISVYAGSYTTNFSITSNDYDEPVTLFNLSLLVTGDPELSTSGNINFGNIELNTTAVYPFRLTNTGTDTLWIDSIVITEATFIKVNTIDYILPGTTDTLNISFSPPSDIVYTGILTVYSDAAINHELAVNIQGRGIKPQEISVSPLSFTRTVTSGDIRTYTLTISNSGGRDLNYTLGQQNPGLNSLYLDGSGDYINTVNSTILNPDTAITLEAWIFLEDNTREYIIAKEMTTAGAYRLYINNTGHLQFTLNGNRSVISATTIALSQWIHVAASFDGQTMNVYINGLLSNSISSGGFTILPSTENLRIGRSFANEFFKGRIDEVRIWGISHNATEIRSLMNQSLRGSEHGLLLYYRFDETTGIITDDLSLNNHTGTFYGNATRISSGIPVDNFFSLSATSGIVPPFSSRNITVTVNTTGYYVRTLNQLITIQSNDDDEPEILVPFDLTIDGTSNASVSKDSMIFADQFFGYKDTVTVSIINTGAGYVVLSGWTNSNAAYRVLDAYTEVLPYAEKQVRVEFAPLLPGLIIDTLRFATNDINHPSFKIALKGLGVEPPEVHLSDSSVDFGPVIVPVQKDSSIVVKNTGVSPLIVSSISSSSPVFTITNTSFTLNSGDSTTIVIRFTPDDYLIYSGTITLNTNIGPSHLMVSGSGIRPGDDIGIISLVSPVSGCGLGDSLEVRVMIRNFGSSAQTGFNVGYKINNDTTVIENTGALSLPVGSTRYYSFMIAADLGDTGSYIIKSFTLLPADQAIGNDTLTIAVNNFPVLNISVSPDRQICQGQSTTLSAAASQSTFIWSNGSHNSYIQVSPATSTNYYVTATNNNGCVDRDSIDVTVLALPSAPVITPQGGTTICIYDSLQITSNISNVHWSNGRTGSSITVRTTGQFTATHTDSNNCSSVSNIINVTTEQVPLLQVNGFTTICKGDYTVLTVNNGLTYQWSTGETVRTINVSPLISSTFYCTITTTRSCRFIDSVLITVIDPVPPSQVGNMLPINASTNVFKPIQFSWSPATNASVYDIYIWKSSDVQPGTPTIGNINTINYIYSATNLEYGTTYKWMVVSKNSCHETAGPVQTFTLRYLPDLITGAIQTPPTIYSGQPLSITWEISNTGEGSTNSQQWRDAAYLSLDSVLSGDDILLGSTDNLSYLVPGQSYSQTATYLMPNDLIGNYYVLIMADYNNSVGESDESNNSGTEPDAIITVTLQPRADLIVTSVGVPTSIFSGNTIMVNYQVQNTSSANAMGNSIQPFSIYGGTYYEHYWYDAIYISTEPTFSISKSLKLKDVYVGLRSVKNPDAGSWYTVPDYLREDSSYSRIVPVTIPHSYYGTYYIYVLTDSYESVNEDAENNNLIKSLAINVILRPPADLVVDTVIAPVTALSGQTLPITYSVRNKGGNPPIETTWQDRIYISTVDTFNATLAVLKSTVTITNGNQLNPDDVYTRTANITLDNGVTGNYYVYVLSDYTNQVFEYTYDTNNSGRSINHIQIDLAPYADLMVNSVLIADTIYAESSYPVTYTISNTGSGIAPASWTDRIFLSSSPVWNPANALRLLSVDRTTNLVTGASYTKTVTVNIPDNTSGTHYIYVFADHANNVYEHTAENNNVTGSSIIAIDTTTSGGAGPADTTAVDLAITGFTSAVTGQSGSAFNLSWTVSNLGDRSTVNYWYDHIFLSSDSNYSTNDIRLDYNTHYGVLNPGQFYTVSRTATLPNGITGNYYILLITDHEIRNTTDIIRTNNISRSPMAVTLTPPPDLVVQTFTLPATVIAGQQLRIPFTIRNAGTGATREGSWQEMVFISTTPDLTGSYVQSGVYNRNSNLNAGATYTDSVTINVPPYLSGYYYVIFRTDGYNRVYEHNNETNNDKVSFIQILVPDPSDLIVSNVVMPGSVNLGQNINVSLTIKNTGANPAIGNLSDAAYFSIDTIYNSTQDKLLKTYQGFVNIAPGDSITRIISNKMPGVIPGPYYGIGRTNLLNSVVESDINNNIRVSDDTLSVSVNQLYLNQPDTFGLDIGDMVYYKVIVGSDLDLLITLSGNQANGSNEIYVAYGRVPSVNDFDFLFDSPGEVNQRVLIPTTQSGTYYILIKTPTNYYGLQQAVILARALPFSILAIEKDTVGNGIVTTRIDGAGFKPFTKFYLLAQDSTVLDSAVMKKFLNSMQVYVQWDFSNDTTGTYHIRAVNNDTTRYTKINGLVIEESTGFLIDFNYVAPNMIRLNGKATFTFFYENIGNIDIPYIKGDYTVPTYTSLFNMSTSGKVFKRSALVRDTSLGPLNDYVDYDNFRHIPTIAKNIAPGEIYSVTLMFRDFGNSAIFPLRVRAYGYSTEGFIRNQLTMAEGVRSHMDQYPTDYTVEQNIQIMNLAANKAAWRDSLLNFHFRTGLLSPSDTIGFNLNCAECVSGFGLESGQTGQYTYDPGFSPGIEKYVRTSFDAGEDYLWEINHANGKPGANPGWDLVEVTGQINITATSINPFIIRLASLNNENEPDYLAGWYPAENRCWPVAVAHQGITGFASNKFALDLSRFSPYNDLYSGTFSVQLHGDTIMLCFNGDTTISVTPLPDYPVSQLPSDGIPCGRMDDLGQTICNDVFRTLHCDPASVGCFNSFAVESTESLNGSHGVAVALLGAASCGINISNCTASLASGDYQSPNSFPGVDLLGCSIAQSGGSPAVNCNGQFICTPVVRSCDPNDIIGPRGYGAGRYISIYEILPYTIRFENDSTFATTAAQRVRITQTLDNNLDPLSFRVKDFGFANFVFKVNYNTASYFNTLDMHDSLGYDLEVTAGIDISKNEAFWNFQTIDPRTGLPPTDPLLGFLSLNDAFGRGEGFVNYTVKPLLNSLSGDTIHAKATIVFDINQPIITPQIFNKIDKDKPVSYVNLLPGNNDSIVIPVDIDGFDEPKGSGVNYYKLYISENNGRFRYIGDYLPDSMILFQGAADMTYKFFSIAVDHVGHVEPMKYFEEAVTVIKLDKISIAPLINDVSCYGQGDGSVLMTVTGGEKPYTFHWSNGATTEDIINLGPASYIVTITDIRDTTIIDTFTIVEPAQVDVWLGNDTAFIPFTYILLNATPAFDNYLWSDSSINSTLQVNNTGTYWVEVERGGCTDRDSIDITIVTVLTAAANITHVSCYGAANGSIQMIVAGGTTPYRFNWSTGQTTQILTGIPAGLYSVTIMDMLDSIFSSNYTVLQPPPLGVNLGIDTFILAGTSALLNAGPIYDTYLWDDGSTLSTRSVDSTGIYHVTVTFNGCSDADTVQVTTLLPFHLASDTVFGCTGQPTIVDAGPGYDSYLWSNGNTTQIGTLLTAGKYSVTVVKSTQQEYDSLQVILRASPIVSLGADVSIKTNESVTLHAPLGLANYLWNDSSTLDYLTINGAIGVGTYLYHVTVSNLNNCSASDTVQITVTPVGSITLTFADADIRIYPSPTAGILYFDMGDYNKTLNVKISTVTNQVLQDTKIKEYGMLDITTLPQGIYLITIQAEGKEITTKIIKY